MGWALLQANQQSKFRGYPLQNGFRSILFFFFIVSALCTQSEMGSRVGKSQMSQPCILVDPGQVVPWPQTDLEIGRVMEAKGVEVMRKAATAHARLSRQSDKKNKKLCPFCPLCTCIRTHFIFTGQQKKIDMTTDGHTAVMDKAQVRSEHCSHRFYIFINSLHII